MPTWPRRSMVFAKRRRCAKRSPGFQKLPPDQFGSNACLNVVQSDGPEPLSEFSLKLKDFRLSVVLVGCGVQMERIDVESLRVDHSVVRTPGPAKRDSESNPLTCYVPFWADSSSPCGALKSGISEAVTPRIAANTHNGSPGTSQGNCCQNVSVHRYTPTAKSWRDVGNLRHHANRIEQFQKLRRIAAKHTAT